MKTNIGLRIRRLREERGLSLTDFGKAVGMRKSAICNIESGRNGTNLENLIKIADYFNVSLDFLVGRDANSPQRPLYDSPQRPLYDFSEIEKQARAANRKLINMVKIIELEKERLKYDVGRTAGNSIGKQGLRLASR